MKKWKKFEDECLYFLQHTYPQLTFIASGGSDSNKEDIQVKKNGYFLFNIEIKKYPAHSGQFVVLQNDKTFSLSQNVKNENPHTQSIIDYLNKNTIKFKNITQNKIDIDCSSDLIINWVKHHYKNKDCKYILTSNKINGFKSLIPIDELEKHFTVSAHIRKKKSGSRKVPIREITVAKNLLRKHSKKLNVHYEIIEQGNDIVVISNESFTDKECYFSNQYFLSETNPNTYKVRKLGATNNPSVLFTLDYKSLHGFDLLNNYI